MRYRLWDKVDRVMIYPDDAFNLYITLDGRVVEIRTRGDWSDDHTDETDVSNRYIIMRDSGIVDGVNVPVYEGDIVQCKCAYKALTYAEWDKGKRLEKINPSVHVMSYIVIVRDDDGCLQLGYDLELSKLAQLDADGIRRLVEYTQYGRSSGGEREMRMYRFRVAGNVCETNGGE